MEGTVNHFDSDCVINDNDTKCIYIGDQQLQYFGPKYFQIPAKLLKP